MDIETFKREKPRLYETCKCIMHEVSNHPYNAANELKSFARDCKKFLESALFKHKATQKNANLIFWCSKIMFYGHHLAWNKDEWLKSALIVYNYYKAKEITDKIKSYEKIFNVEIVHDFNLVMDYFYNKFSKDEEIEYEEIQGLTSMFTLVPLSTLNEKMNSYKWLYE